MGIGEAFLLGVVAGYAIAIPFGPIAILIVRTGVRRGLRAAAAAGAGAATADLVFATIAMLFGAAASALLAPILPAARLLAGAALAIIALRSLLAAPPVIERDSGGAGTGSTYLLFLGLTMLNPPTVIYFVSLAVALPELSADFGSRAAFVVGAFLSSLSWQEFLAVIGAMLHGRLTPRLQRMTAVVSSLIILALAARVAFG
ncbi:MAG TPA: LysE family transporter [Candidatus Bathyarchaeia archaeon]|nr:LysE family transporter [Candidatus Bathyarchaeia archaeon]